MSSSVTAQNRNDIYELITHTYKNTFTLKNIFKILLEKKIFLIITIIMIHSHIYSRPTINISLITFN